MKPYELLMVEHSLISRLFRLVDKEVKKIDSGGKADGNFIDILTDFFITYIDVAHHGKEENILFKALNEKKLSAEHKQVINLLLDEHKLGRRLIEELIHSSNAYFKGDEREIRNIRSRLVDFTTLYRKHVEKEDHSFFIDCMKYLTSAEQENIVQDFYRLNISLIDEKYKKIFELMEEP